MLIVGCGCRGRALAAELVAGGLAVRGSSRDARRRGAIEASGVEAVLADPDRLGTLLASLEGVAAVCWLMGSAAGDSVSAVHGARLRAFLERLVDTPVRGFVYEAAGSVDARLLESGSAAVRRAGRTWRLPVQIVEHDPSERAGWVAAMAAAVSALLGTGSGETGYGQHHGR